MTRRAGPLSPRRHATKSSIVATSQSLAVLLTVTIVMVAGCGGGGGAARAGRTTVDDIARALGRPSDEVGQYLDDVSRTTGRSSDDLARKVESALPARGAGASATQLQELSEQSGFARDFATGVICGVLDQIGADGTVTDAELSKTLSSAVLNAGFDHASFVLEVTTILLRDDPDGYYDIVTLAVNQLQICFLEGL